MTARRNAMLTTEDRRWLTGEKRYDGEHAKQQRYQRRRDIRERIDNSIRDLTIVFERLEPTEQRKMFESVRTDDRVSDDPELTRGVRDGIAFLLHATGVTDGMVDSGENVAETLAGTLLTEAIEAAGRKEGFLVERVDIEVDAQPMNRSRLAERLAGDEPVTAAELAAAIEHEAVDTASVQTHVREMLVDDAETDLNNEDGATTPGTANPDMEDRP